MRKWQVDTKVYNKRRNELLTKVGHRFSSSADERIAIRDFCKVVRNLDEMIESVAVMNWHYRYQERTPQGYRKAVARVDQCLDEVEQLAAIFLLTYCVE